MLRSHTHRLYNPAQGCTTYRFLLPTVGEPSPRPPCALPERSSLSVDEVETSAPPPHLEMQLAVHAVIPGSGRGHVCCRGLRRLYASAMRPDGRAWTFSSTAPHLRRILFTHTQQTNNNEDVPVCARGGGRHLRAPRVVRGGEPRPAVEVVQGDVRQAVQRRGRGPPQGDLRGQHAEGGCA